MVGEGIDRWADGWDVWAKKPPHPSAPLNGPLKRSLLCARGVNGAGQAGDVRRFLTDRRLLAVDVGKKRFRDRCRVELSVEGVAAYVQTPEIVKLRVEFGDVGEGLHMITLDPLESKVEFGSGDRYRIRIDIELNRLCENRVEEQGGVVWGGVA